MITIRRHEDRGKTKLSWLESRHTFSFGDYHDPDHMNFHSLRVMNEDTVKGGKGFDPHPHRDAEIFTYVLEGSLSHTDSQGNSATITFGEAQLMSAGTGIRHSEYNPHPTEDVHFYQIWIIPGQTGLKPSYQQRPIYLEETMGQWHLLISPEKSGKALLIRQDAKIFVSNIQNGKSLEYKTEAGRHLWLQVLRGSVALSGKPMTAGDGAALENERTLTLRAQQDSECLLFDLGG